MAALLRLASVSDGSAGPPAPDPAPAEPGAFPETFSSRIHLLSSLMPLADKLEANEDTKKSRAMCLKRLVEHVAEPDKPLKLLDVLSATAVQTYCGKHAPNSVDTYCKTICAFIRLVSTAQGNDTLPDDMQKEILALDSLCADAEVSARAEAAAPPELADFYGPALELFEAMQNGEARAQMSYSELALNCWLLFQIFGVPTRARTLLTARWNEHITFLSGGNDVRIQLGDTSGSPGKKTKLSFPLDLTFSDLQGLHDVGLLRTDIARTALSWLWNRTEFHGLVFSRADLHGSDSPFGKDRFNQAMTALTGFTDGCGKLRKRLET